MKFKFVANIEFDADDIDYAFSELAYHFLNLRDGLDNVFQFQGSMDISPVNPTLRIFIEERINTQDKIK